MALEQKTIAKLRPGTQIKVFEKIVEGDKKRTAFFTGTILAVKHGTGIGATMTVRNSSLAGVGVERIFPLHSPVIEKVEVLKKPKRVRRAKLYYLRNVSKKRARQKLSSKDTVDAPQA